MKIDNRYFINIQESQMALFMDWQEHVEIGNFGRYQFRNTMEFNSPAFIELRDRQYARMSRANDFEYHALKLLNRQRGKEIAEQLSGKSLQDRFMFIREAFGSSVARRNKKFAEIIFKQDSYRFRTETGSSLRYVLGLPYIPMQEIHMLDISAEDKTQVVYYQDVDKLLANRQTRTRLGKYLARFFGEQMTEVEIKQKVERFNQMQQPIDLCFVETDNPDDWVNVYEKGSGFNSCMVYNHPHQRYIECGLKDDLHPVRTYCYPGNGLRLAYIGNGKKPSDEGFKCYARAIVTDNDNYWRVFGDDRLNRVLQDNGFSYYDSALDGVRLAARKHPDRSDCLIVPYLDGCATQFDYEDGDRYITVRDSGQYDGQHSTGVAELEPNGVECDECGDRCDEDDINYIESTDRHVCPNCLDNNYRYAHGRRYQTWFPEDDCVYCESDGEWYAVEYAANHDVYQCAATDDWYHIDDLSLIERDGEHVHHDEATYCEHNEQWIRSSEAVELHDGNYAHEDDAVELHDGRYALENDVVELRNGDYALGDEVKMLPDETYCLTTEYDELMELEFSDEDDEVDAPLTNVVATEPERLAA